MTIDSNLPFGPEFPEEFHAAVREFHAHITARQARLRAAQRLSPRAKVRRRFAFCFLSIVAAFVLGALLGSW